MKRTFALLLGLFAVFPAVAGPWADALEQAWSRHPLAAAAPAREESARAQAELAAAMTPGPASLSLSNLNDRLNGHRGKEEWEMELAVPLWLSGQKAAHAAEAESNLVEVAALREAERLELAGELREAWWSLAAAREARMLAGLRMASARSLEVGVTRRYQAGDLARVDANLARNERLAAEAAGIEAEDAVRRAEQAWRKLTGSPAPARLPPETAAPAPASAEVAPDHPRLAALAATARLAHARLKVAMETRRDAPELALRALRERSDSNDRHANSLGIKLTIPFSSDARNRHGNSAARSEVALADAELALARHSVELEIDKARRELDAAERQIAMARERRALIADNLALAEKSFALGESDLAALLRVRAGAFETEATLSRLGVARDAAHSRLLQARGVMP